MEKSTTLRTLMTLLGCLFITPSFTSWEGLSAEAAVPIPQQQPSGCGDSEPMTDLKTGVIANPKGVEIGALKDFVLDLKAGRAAYTVGVFDQIGELSNRVFVLSWEAVKVDPEMNTFTAHQEVVWVILEPLRAPAAGR